MRILMINHEFSISGASTIFHILAEEWRRRGHAVAILPCNPEPGPIRDRYLAGNFPILSNDALATADQHFDIAIANTIASAGTLLHLPPALPAIWYLHEAEVALRILAEQPQWREAFARASAVIYNMPFQAEVFRSFTYALTPWKFHTVPFGVEIDHVAVSKIPLPAKRRALRIVQVGTIEPRKRPGDLIRAVAMTKLDAECVLCGRLYHIPPDARALVDAAPDRYRIISDAAEDEALAWQQSADIVTLVSASETQGLVAYQAALLGRPLILTDLPCYRDVFVHGRDCLMVPPASPAMLALAIGALAANPGIAAALGRNARTAAARFTRRGYLAQMAGVLETVAARRDAQ